MPVNVDPKLHERLTECLRRVAAAQVTLAEGDLAGTARRLDDLGSYLVATLRPYLTRDVRSSGQEAAG